MPNYIKRVQIISALTILLFSDTLSLHKYGNAAEDNQNNTNRNDDTNDDASIVARSTCSS